MSVWYAIPSKRPAPEAEACLLKWRAQGYKIAVWRDAGEALVDVDWQEGSLIYPGYAVAVNRLVGHILRIDPDAQWIVTGGDDVHPEPGMRAERIAEQCWMYFRELHWKRADEATAESTIVLRSRAVAAHRDHRNDTFGVMQPTGDRWGDDHPGPWLKGSAYIDRICGSPWMGRAFCERINQGRGPLREEFTHMFVDEALQEIAIKYGCFWQRRDLIHFHDHWARTPGTSASACPEFLKQVNAPEHWVKSKAILEKLKAAGWPGSEPL